MIEFLCEVREVKTKKLVTNDKEITIRLNTDDIRAEQLREMIGEIRVLVKIEEVKSQTYGEKSG